MIRALLAPRGGSLVVSAIVAAFAWFQTSLSGLDRVLTVAAASVLAYLVFNATGVLLDRYA